MQPRIQKPSGPGTKSRNGQWGKEENHLQGIDLGNNECRTNLIKEGEYHSHRIIIMGMDLGEIQS